MIKKISHNPQAPSNTAYSQSCASPESPATLWPTPVSKVASTVSYSGSPPFSTKSKAQSPSKKVTSPP